MVPRKLLNRFARYVKRRFFRVLDPLDHFAEVTQRLGITHLIDAGAHIGDAARRIAGPQTEVVHCFEPLPESFDRLCKAVAGPRFRTWKIALSDEDGTATFRVGGNEQTSSLLDPEATVPRGLERAMAVVSEITVETMKLDTWMQQVDVGPRYAMKVDVQGAELRLFEGGREFLSQHVDYIVCEANLVPMYAGQSDLWSLQHALTGLGFVLFNIYRTVKDEHGMALWTDASWIKPAALERLRSGSRA